MLPPSYQNNQHLPGHWEIHLKLDLGACDQWCHTVNRNTQGQKARPPPCAKLSIHKLLWWDKTNGKVTEDCLPRKIWLRARASAVGARNLFPSLNWPVLNIYSCWWTVTTWIKSHTVLLGAPFSHGTPANTGIFCSSQQVILVKALWCTWNMWRGSWQPCRCLTQKSAESDSEQIPHEQKSW